MDFPAFHLPYVFLRQKQLQFYFELKKKKRKRLNLLLLAADLVYHAPLPPPPAGIYAGGLPLMWHVSKLRLSELRVNQNN